MISNRTRIDPAKTKTLKTGARILSRESKASLAGICENNWGQGEQPKAKTRPCIWYYLEPRLNVPDQQLSFPPRLFGRN
jgi:hypothetical protein